MNKIKSKVNVLMCGSDLTVNGGIVSVVKNYLTYDNWEQYNITYVPTHIEGSSKDKTLYFSKSLVKIIQKLVFDDICLVHLHTAERGSFFRKALIVKIAKLFRKKVVLHHHAAEFDSFFNDLSKIKRKFVINTLESSNVNIVLSEDLIPMIRDKTTSANIQVLNNSVSTYLNYQYTNKDNNILFLGRLGKRKGIYDLLEVIRELDDVLDTKIKFYLCGDGEIDKVKAIIDKYRIKHRINHVGWIDGLEKDRIFSSTLINILPSYNEGLPMTILETMSLGIPNISTNIASIPKVIENGYNGFIIEPGDKNKLAEKILELVNDGVKRSEFSHRSYKMIKEEFSMESGMKRLKNIYDELISLKGGEND